MAGPSIKTRIAKKLHQALQSEHNSSGRVIWRSGTKVQMGKDWTFTLRYDVIARRSESGKPELRFEWIKRLRDFKPNTDRIIYPVEGTLTPVGFKKRGYLDKHGVEKERLIKHQRHNSLTNPVTNADREYSMARIGGHIRMKKPVFFGNASLLVMEKFPGKDLFHRLYEIGNGIDISQRMAITQELLRAYRSQIHDLGLVHRDIKPENIMVEIYDDGSVEVNIIDYGLTTPAGKLEYGVGTLGYLPPELFRGPIQQHRSQDLFSLACVIAEIWGIDKEAVPQTGQTQAGTKELAPQPGDWRAWLHSLFTYAPKPNSVARALIEDTLHKMLDPNPKTRLTLDKTEAAFQQIDSILKLDPIATREDENEAVLQQAQPSMTQQPIAPPRPSGNMPFLPPPSPVLHGFFSPLRKTQSLDNLNDQLAETQKNPNF